MLVNAGAIKNKRLRTTNPSGKSHLSGVQAELQGESGPSPGCEVFQVARNKKEAGEKRLENIGKG